MKVGGTEEVAEVSFAFNAMADSLQQAETLRRNLMADVAHELRTPLTVLQGNLRAMLDGVYPLERGEIATLYDETRLLNRLVDDLRELALAEAGQLKLNLQSIDLAALIGSTAANFMPVAEERGLTLEAKIEQAVEVRADPDRVAQVLRNLIANALWHTRRRDTSPSRRSPSIRVGGSASRTRVKASRLKICRTFSIASIAPLSRAPGTMAAAAWAWRLRSRSSKRWAGRSARRANWAGAAAFGSPCRAQQPERVPR